MAKPKPITVPSNDCAVTIDGETYYPHEGESVELWTNISVAEIHARARLLMVSIDHQQHEPGTPAWETSSTELDVIFSELCSVLARRLKSWTWTDMAGRALPQPDGTGAQLEALDPQEVSWLLTASSRPAVPDASASGPAPVKAA